MRLGWGLSSAADAAQQECCEPGSTLLCMGLFSRFFVQALPCTTEGTLCRVRDTRSLVPRAYGTNRSNSNTSCSRRLLSLHLSQSKSDISDFDNWICPTRVNPSWRARERRYRRRSAGLVLDDYFDLELLFQKLGIFAADRAGEPLGAQGTWKVMSRTTRRRRVRPAENAAAAASNQTVALWCPVRDVLPCVMKLAQAPESG
jgi:hypothetical protein